MSQSRTRVSKPELILDNDQLIISYDIIAAKQNDIFKVWVEITDADDKKISALALSGDIGDQVSGGKGKKINWNFTKDNIDPETEIFLEVYAELQETAEEEPEEVAENKPAEVVENKTEEASGSVDEGTHGMKRYSTGKSLYKSVLFPGLGFAGIDQSRFHLVKGVAGYGLVASSLVFNRLAVNNRANYLAEQTDESKRNNYYDTYIRQDIISKVFAYSAIGIWTAEMVWLLIELNTKNKISVTFPVRLAPGYDPVLGSPTLCLSYQF